MRRLKKVNKRVLIQTIIITVIVFIAALLCIFPFYWMILNSLKNPDLINQGTVDLITFDLTWESFKAVFSYNNGLIWKAYLNSFIIAIVDVPRYKRKMLAQATAENAENKVSEEESAEVKE